MALDELHARRLATVISVFEDSLNRIEMLLVTLERGEGPEPRVPAPTPAKIQEIRALVQGFRYRLRAGARYFNIQRLQPDWRQTLAAELAALWVILENAAPARMKGYGRQFTTEDRAGWEALLGELDADIERLRKVALGGLQTPAIRTRARP